MKKLVLLLTSSLILASLGFALVVEKLGIITEIRQVAGIWQIKTDYVENRECSSDDCPSGFKIINKNPLIRTFKFTKNTKILVLKNAGEYRPITAKQLIEARAGKNFGWGFDKENPFYLKVDETKKTVLELRQMYLP